MGRGRMKQPSTSWRAVMRSGIRSVHKSGNKPPLVKWWQPIRAIQMCPFGAIESCLEKIKACFKGCKWELSAHDDSSPTPLSAALHEATGSTGKQVPCSKKGKSWWFVFPISDKCLVTQGQDRLWDKHTSAENYCRHESCQGCESR